MEQSNLPESQVELLSAVDVVGAGMFPKGRRLLFGGYNSGRRMPLEGFSLPRTQCGSIFLILFELEPEEGFAEDPWYDKYHQFDEHLANRLQDLIDKFVFQKSFPRSIKPGIPQFYERQYDSYPTVDDIYKHLLKSDALGDQSASFICLTVTSSWMCSAWIIIISLHLIRFKVHRFAILHIYNIYTSPGIASSKGVL